MLKINVRHSLIQTCFLEIRFAPETSIGEVKDRVHRMTGTPPEFQELVLVRPGYNCVLAPDRATLLDFGARSGDEISVTDRNPAALFGPAFQKAARDYVPPVADEARYRATPGTVYDQIRTRLRTDPAFRQHYDEAMRRRQEAALREFERASHITLGDRCQISGHRRGVVRFVGEKPLRGAGIYVGIQLDEPLGDCDGDGEFQCDRNFGAFVNVMDVETGDFPELGLSELETSGEL